MAKPRFPVRPTYSDGIKDTDIGFEDLRFIFHAPSANTIKRRSGKDNDFETLWDGLQSIFDGASAFSDTDIRVIDGDLGILRGLLTGRAVTGLTVVEQDKDRDGDVQRIFAFQSGGPRSALDALGNRKITDPDARAVDALRKNSQMGQLIDGMISHDQDGAPLEISVSALIDMFRAEQIVPNDEQARKVLGQFRRGEDGAMAYVDEDPHGRNDTFIAFSSEKDENSWFSYMARHVHSKDNDNGYEVTATKFGEQNGKLTVDALSVELDANNRVVATRTVVNGKRTSVRILPDGTIKRWALEGVLYYDAGGNLKKVTDVNNRALSSREIEGLVNSNPYINFKRYTFEQAQEELRAAYDKVSNRATHMMKDDDIDEQITAVGRRLRFATTDDNHKQGVDLIDSPTDSLLKPSEFLQISKTPRSRS